jgi:uncharacterized membrane protein YwaF
MGWWKPSWRYYPATIGVGVALMAIAYPVNKWTDSNYFFVNWPERGTVLEFFGSVLGRPMYLPVLVAVAAIVIALMFSIWSIIDAFLRHHARRSSPVDRSSPVEAPPVGA